MLVVVIIVVDVEVIVVLVGVLLVGAFPGVRVLVVGEEESRVGVTLFNRVSLLSPWFPPLHPHTIHLFMTVSPLL